MTNKNGNHSNRQDKKDVIYNSADNRNNTHVTHQADGDTYKDGRKVREGEHHDKVVVEDRDNVRHDHIDREPKKKSPWAWLLPLLLLALLAILALSFCNNKDDEDDKDKTDSEVKTEEKATTEDKEETTTEEATTEEASIKKFDLASITNFDLAS